MLGGKSMRSHSWYQTSMHWVLNTFLLCNLRNSYWQAWPLKFIHIRSQIGELLWTQNWCQTKFLPALKFPEQFVHKWKCPHVSHVLQLFFSGVSHPYLIVVLPMGSDELPALDLSLTQVYVPCLAFWCFCINVKPPNPNLEQHCNVYFIGFISSFFHQSVVLFFSILCLFSYWLWWHVFASPPTFFSVY